MTSQTTPPSAASTPKHDLEEGLVLAAAFDQGRLLAAVATDADTGEVLMLAWMNGEALARTVETGEAHFFSRSRDRLWKKGEESGNVLEVIELRTDCDQDAIWLRVRTRGAGAACHTGRTSCFYRRIPLHQPRGTSLRLEMVRDPSCPDRSKD